jgi:hypothetical protein
LVVKKKTLMYGGEELGSERLGALIVVVRSV